MAEYGLDQILFQQSVVDAAFKRVIKYLFCLNIDYWIVDWLIVWELELAMVLESKPSWTPFEIVHMIVESVAI